MVKGKVLAGLFLTLASLSSTAIAQGTKVSAKTAGAQPAKSTAAAPAPDRARFDALRAEGFEQLYNLDYEGARRTFNEIVRLFPDHPAGPQFLAATVWLKTLNESRRLQASLYNTEGFYAKEKDVADPKVVTEFRELTRQAKELADARYRKDPNDLEALYYLGAVEGLKAAFAGAVERSFYSAWRNGEEAADKHRKVIKADPNYHDAEITIGMYDYVAATLPLPFKVGGAMMGVRGSKKRGLATLARVASEGTWARDDAKVLLLALLKREGRFAESLAPARELAAKYPHNYLFKLEVADALVSQAALDRATKPEQAAQGEREAFDIFDTLLRQKPAKNEPVRPLDLIHFSFGQALAVAGQYERAAAEYLAGAAVPNAEAGLATMSRLRAAQSLDLAGKRDAALVQYKAVLARPNVYDSHEEAKRGLSEPFKQPSRSADDTSDDAAVKPETGGQN
jgi:tetratricopeptide (TPR) repeat protein